MAWKPPSACRISPLTARDQPASRKQTASATAPASSESQPSGAWRCQASARSPKPGMPPAAAVAIGPGGHQVHARAVAAQVARQVARDRLQRRLGHAHPVVGGPGHGGVEVQPHQAAAVGRGGQQRAQPGAQRLERVGAGGEGRGRALGRGVQEVAAQRLGRGVGDGVQHAVHAAPARFSSAASASMSSGRFTSSSSTSGRSGSRAAARSVSRRARPKPVSTTSAPASWARSATAKAMLWRVTTPGDHQLPALEHHSGTGTKAGAPGPDRHAPAPGRPGVPSACRRSRSVTRPCSSSSSPGVLHHALHGQLRAGGHRPLEHHVVQAAQRHHPVGVELQLADGEGHGQQPVRHLAAEAAAGGPGRDRCAGGGCRRSGPRRPGCRRRSRCAARPRSGCRAPGRRRTVSRLTGGSPVLG